MNMIQNQQKGENEPHITKLTFSHNLQVITQRRFIFVPYTIAE